MSSPTSGRQYKNNPYERVSFSSVTGNNIGIIRVLNSTLFPIQYSQRFYKQIVQPELEKYCKLIYLNDVPVGTVCCRLEEIDNETKLYVMTMGVLAPYRNRKIGSQALQHILDAARESKKPKITSVYLHVWVESGDAKRFYERHGFKEVGLVVDYYKKMEKAKMNPWNFKRCLRLRRRRTMRLRLRSKRKTILYCCFYSEQIDLLHLVQTSIGRSKLGSDADHL